ncbi:MAG: cytochrome P450 [Pseudomonadales bacterium]|nr:cytochrome P450 [Pseudomonadales bacterium]
MESQLDSVQPQEIPRVPGHWLLGNLLEFKRAPHRFLSALAKQGQGLVQFRLFHKKMIAITSPECAQQLFKSSSKNYPRGAQRKSLESILGLGLITQEGRLWKHHRRVVAQAFRPDFLEYSLEQNSRLLAKLLQRWDGMANQGKSVDVVDETRRITLSVIVRALFSKDIDLSKNRELYGAIVNANHLMFTRHTSLFRFPDWIPTPLNRKVARTRAVMDAFIAESLAEKESRSAGLGGEQDAATSKDIADHFLQAEAAGDISRAQIFDEIRTLLVAGFETTATSLAWTLYLLARHPEVMEVWHAELDSVLAGDLPKWEHMSQLPYTEYIVMEGMRLFPPAYGLTRTSLEEDVIEGFRMPANASIVLSIYGIQHDERYWQDPEKFDPGRFSREWREDAFLPFGMGKHICIGSRFSILESMLVLASIGQRFEIELISSAEVEPNAQVTLLPGSAIQLRLESRVS